MNTEGKEVVYLIDHRLSLELKKSLAWLETIRHHLCLTRSRASSNWAFMKQMLCANLVIAPTNLVRNHGSSLGV
ncbi:hypothetical protein O181_088768 [Austropuccinia psidii MF-1]|uniref:Uncharacterized protein n=1 Tax=Austropuccinia psidii MF-1 TaxID=1389203 RepID=A0A9Q3IS30_9BASI|nr:hypothetical protein [Austropuccinia psidii MF-1]